jgi:uncharacterized repeat protein (TIGR01451 family)
VARSTVSRTITVLLALALALLFMQPAGVSAQGTITLTPNSGPQGTQVTITGSGYGSGTVINVYFGGAFIGNVQADAGGNIPAGTTFTVPNVAYGTYNVTASSPSASATTTFQVTPNTAAIQLTPNTGPSGTTVTLTGSGFRPNETLNVYFGGAFLGSVMATSSGAIPANTTFTVPTAANGPYTVTVAGSLAAAQATFTVTTATTPAFTESKTVSVNGNTAANAQAARPGDTLTYTVRLTNTTGATITGATILDTLAGGQSAPSTATVSCSYTVATRQLACPVGDIANNTSVSVQFTTVVASGTAGQTLYNTATAQSTSGQTATSNTTAVTVSSVPVTTGGSIILCGPIASYTANSSISISGITLPIANGATVYNVTGYPLTVGSDVCLSLTLNGAGAVSAIQVEGNLAGVGVICGAYAPGSTAGYISVGGVPVVLAASFTGLAPGYTYCFLLTSTGGAYAVLSYIPTSVIPLRQHHYYNRPGFQRAA